MSAIIGAVVGMVMGMGKKTMISINSSFITSTLLMNDHQVTCDEGFFFVQTGSKYLYKRFISYS
jgi:hypothetical protein